MLQNAPKLISKRNILFKKLKRLLKNKIILKIKPPPPDGNRTLENRTFVFDCVLLEPPVASNCPPLPPFDCNFVLIFTFDSTFAWFLFKWFVLIPDLRCSPRRALPRDWLRWSLSFGTTVNWSYFKSAFENWFSDGFWWLLVLLPCICWCRGLRRLRSGDLEKDRLRTDRSAMLWSKTLITSLAILGERALLWLSDSSETTIPSPAKRCALVMNCNSLGRKWPARGRSSNLLLNRSPPADSMKICTKSRCNPSALHSKTCSSVFVLDNLSSSSSPQVRSPGRNVRWPRIRNMTDWRFWSSVGGDDV